MQTGSLLDLPQNVSQTILVANRQAWQYLAGKPWDPRAFGHADVLAEKIYCFGGSPASQGAEIIGDIRSDAGWSCARQWGQQTEYERQVVISRILDQRQHGPQAKVLIVQMGAE